MSLLEFIKNVKSRKINDQELFFLNIEEWNLFIEKTKAKNSLNDIIKRDLILMQNYRELQLTLGFTRKDNYLPYMLLNVNSLWQRISIEKRNCLSCEWTGLVGLTNRTDIYAGMPQQYNKIELINNAMQIKKKGCPKCGKTFKEHTIWTEK